MTTETTETPKTDQPEESGPTPLVYLVKFGRGAATVKASLNTEDEIAHWTIKNEALTPMQFSTSDELLNDRTYEVLDDALADARTFVRAFHQMVEQARAADDILRDLTLGGTVRGRSPFPPGGEIVGGDQG